MASAARCRGLADPDRSASRGDDDTAYRLQLDAEPLLTIVTVFIASLSPAGRPIRA